MSTQKQKFELFSRLQALGFTYDEATQLRRIEMTLHRWAELECGTEGHNPQFTLCIEREDNGDGKPFMRQMGPGYGGTWIDRRWPVADRERGALRRLKTIVEQRNDRVTAEYFSNPKSPGMITYYHQGDPRGCALYLVSLRDLEPSTNRIVDRARELGAIITKCDNPEPTKSPWYLLNGEREKFDVPETAARRFLKKKGEAIPPRLLPVDQYYTRGLAVCA